MNFLPPANTRPGDYVLNFPVERPSDRQTARDAMKRQGCKVIRFVATEIELNDHNGKPMRANSLTAHGYVGRLSGEGMEEL